MLDTASKAGRRPERTRMSGASQLAQGARARDDGWQEERTDALPPKRLTKAWRSIFRGRRLVRYQVQHVGLDEPIMAAHGSGKDVFRLPDGAEGVQFTRV